MGVEVVVASSMEEEVVVVEYLLDCYQVTGVVEVVEVNPKSLKSYLLLHFFHSSFLVVSLHLKTLEYCP